MTLANVVTILRIVVTLPFLGLVLFVKGTHPDDIRFALVPFALFLVISLSDNLNGYLARSRNEVTELGKMLDPIADKLLLGGVLVVLNVVGVMPVWVSALVLFREVGITAFRLILAKRGGKVIAASMLGKLKTLLQTIALLAFLLPFNALPIWYTYSAWAVLIAALLVTYVSGAQYLYRALGVRTKRADMI